MNLADVLIPEQTFCHIQVASKKKALEETAGLIASKINRVSQEALFERLIAREKLGTTAMGNGIAIPHCRLPQLDNIVCALVTLAEPVDFDAFDNHGVSILFVLLVPEEEADKLLSVLATIAESAESIGYRDSLLAANDNDSLYQRAVQTHVTDIKSA